jgi:four helix bundle protein
VWGASSNIAESNGSSTGTDQASFYGIAYKAIVRSTSLVDLATANGIADTSRVEEERKLLRRIAAMMTALSKGTAHVSGHTYSHTYSHT